MTQWRNSQFFSLIIDEIRYIYQRPPDESYIILPWLIEEIRDFLPRVNEKISDFFFHESSDFLLRFNQVICDFFLRMINEIDDVYQLPIYRIRIFFQRPYDEIQASTDGRNSMFIFLHRLMKIDFSTDWQSFQCPMPHSHTDRRNSRF